MIMTHRYYETFDMNSIAGSTATYSFRCNNIADPNWTGGGHQPYYYDQMTGVYNHYTVIGSKITLNIAHAASSNTNSTVCVYVNDDSSVGPTLNSLVETQKAKYLIMPTAQMDPRRLTNTWSMKKQFGSSAGATINPAVSGTTASAPTEESLYSICVFPQNLTSNQTYNCQVMISYIVIWSELKDIVGS